MVGGGAWISGKFCIPRFGGNGGAGRVGNSMRRYSGVVVEVTVRVVVEVTVGMVVGVTVRVVLGVTVGVVVVVTVGWL